MKTLKFNEFVNEAKINEAGGDAAEHLDAVVAALPELEKLIFKYNKLKVKLKAKTKLTRNSNVIEISSDDLSSDLSPLGKTVFREISIGFWGGNVTQDGKNIWFDPKIWYIHPNGLEHGTSFIWIGLLFNIETNKWIEDRRL